jgi:hypothetical protein
VRWCASIAVLLFLAFAFKGRSLRRPEALPAGDGRVAFEQLLQLLFALRLGLEAAAAPLIISQHREIRESLAGEGCSRGNYGPPGSILTGRGRSATRTIAQLHARSPCEPVLA